ncbi:NUDIX domain-containing protein [Sulfitobacter aestuariivivens]|nr:NUDIX hydrolase [Sulfitobacter aestuariivivens]
MANVEPFAGAKMALYIGDRLATILRDDLPGLPYAGQWDLPGGGREGGETAFACVQRECMEELGLWVTEQDLLWEHGFVADGQEKWFFVAALPAAAADEVVFGDEGQRWELMREEAFLSHPGAVGFLQERVRWWCEIRGQTKGPPLA